MTTNLDRIIRRQLNITRMSIINAERLAATLRDTVRDLRDDERALSGFLSECQPSVDGRIGNDHEQGR